ncbi:MAG: DUF3800 domain-containing protein [Chloroflexi bacterium]|nr:DUF3800 domain-containing protein [Chloroflexota bacterium]
MVWFAYADDSGTHKGSEFCLVAGYIGSPRQWKLFRRDWREALGDVPEFHAKDFFPRAAWKSSESPYHGWDERQAAAFLDRLLGIIDSYDLRPIGGATKTEDFFSLTEAQRTWITGATLLTRTHVHAGEAEITDKVVQHEGSPQRPYFVVFPAFFVEAMRATKSAKKPRIHFYFDRQGAAEVRAKEAFDLFKQHLEIPEAANLASLTYAESDEEVGLQAADLYAYVWNRKLSSRMNSELRRAFRSLTKKKKDMFIADKKNYFDRMLRRAARHREAGIEESIAAQS